MKTTHTHHPHHTRNTLPALAAAFHTTLVALALAAFATLAAPQATAAITPSAGVSAAAKTITPSVTPTLVAPVFTTQPLAVSNYDFGIVSGIVISATATASVPITYQWQYSPGPGMSWTNLADTPATANPAYKGSTTNRLTITSIPISMNGSLFRCVATPNATNTTSTTYKPAISNEGKLVVNIPVPVFTTQPQAATTIDAGSGVLLIVTATSTLPITGQWQSSPGPNQPWTNLADTPATATPAYRGSTTARLAITNIPASMNGYLFHNIAKTTVGSGTSNPAKITVTSPTITNIAFTAASTTPEPIKTSSGQLLWRYTIGASITIDRKATVSYHWMNNGPYGGGEQPAKTLTAPKAGTYPLENDIWDIPVASKTEGPFLATLMIAEPPHSPATLSFNTPPAGALAAPKITQQPWPYGDVGQDISFDVRATGIPTPTYHWTYFAPNGASRAITNDNRYSNADKGNLTIHSLVAGDQGDYQCTITNVVGSATTDKMRLTVRPAGTTDASNASGNVGNGTMTIGFNKTTNTSPVNGLDTWTGGPTGLPAIPAPLSPGTVAINTVKNLSAYPIRLSTLVGNARARTTTLAPGASTTTYANLTFVDVRLWVVDGGPLQSPPPNGTQAPRIEVTWKKK